MPETAVKEHPDIANAAAAALCVCDRPMPFEDGLCLKCGRIVPERAGGNHG